MPGALVKGHKLQKLAITSNQQMRRNLHSSNFGEIGMRIPVELIQEQSLDFITAKLPGRKADSVQYDCIDARIYRALIAIWTQTQARRLNKSGLWIDSKVACHDQFRHDFRYMSTRLFVSGALINGAEVEVDGDPARYLSKALRSRVGDQVTLFNGEGPEWPATISQISKSTVVLKLGDGIEANTESALKIHLVQCISRGDRMDFVVQKATELGVKRITPVLSQYGVVKLDNARAEKKREHWQKIAASACEQCGRTRLPLIDTPITLKNWFGNKPASVDAELILTPGAATPLASIATPETKVCVLIGPEGGFSETEYGDATVSGFEAVSLGPRVLRTESAAIATLAVLQSLWGDLR